jgi:acyl carrier protein
MILTEKELTQPDGVENQPTRKESLRDTLMALPASQRTPHLLTFLQGQVAQVLKLPPSRVPLTKPLGPLGLDSLMAIELRGRLEETLSIRLSATFIWSYPTLTQMAPFIAGRIDVPLVEESQPAEQALSETQDSGQAALEKIDTFVDDLLSNIEGLSDESAQDTLLNE